MEFYFMEQMRLAMQSHQFACRQCQYLMLGPWAMFAPPAGAAQNPSESETVVDERKSEA